MHRHDIMAVYKQTKGLKIMIINVELATALVNADPSGLDASALTDYEHFEDFLLSPESFETVWATCDITGLMADCYECYTMKELDTFVNELKAKKAAS